MNITPGLVHLSSKTKMRNNDDDVKDKKDDNDFYVVLPSNSCPDVHPENAPSKFHVSWENPLEFVNGTWKVALVEANFAFKPISISPGLGIQYCNIVCRPVIYRGTLRVNPKTKRATLQYKSSVPGNSEVNDKIWINVFPETDTLIILCRERFRVNSSKGVWNLQDRHSELEGEGENSVNMLVLSDISKDRDPEKEIVENIDIVITKPTPIVEEIFFEEKVSYDTYDRMTADVAERFSKVFKAVTFSKTEYAFNFEVHDSIYEIVFVRGLNRYLGLTDVAYEFSLPVLEGCEGYAFENLRKRVEVNRQLKSDFLPELRDGIEHIYIYASICQPILVGGVRVPLLKSIWVNEKDVRFQKAYGEVRNVAIKNPMYIPVSGTSINSIEVNIRDDAGRYIPFIDGSVVSLTLHFKKHG